MLRRPPRSTRTDTLCPYTTLFRSDIAGADHVLEPRGGGRMRGHMLEINAPLKRFGERRHLFADKQGELHPGRDERSGKVGVPGFTARAEFLHAAENREIGRAHV